MHAPGTKGKPGNMLPEKRVGVQSFLKLSLHLAGLEMRSIGEIGDAAQPRVCGRQPLPAKRL
jgi:hypothetical protein